MLRFDRLLLGRQAKRLRFVRDNLEKVYRLMDVLQFMNRDTLLSTSLALKGGTAINLTIFDLPRLSVDIDLDFSVNVSREEMLLQRQQITRRIEKYMAGEGYHISAKSKRYHALDSFVYEYQNAGGSRDNIKIEINYMLRFHVFEPEYRNVKLPWAHSELKVLCVAPVEIFSTKIIALLTRTAARDLYDIANMVKYDLFSQNERLLLHKCCVLYSAIGTETVWETFPLEAIQRLSLRQIKAELYPVLRQDEHFELQDARNTVLQFLSENLCLEGNDRKFWNCFKEGEFCPELIFGEGKEYCRIKNHPMALWKCKQRLITKNEI